MSNKKITTSGFYKLSDIDASEITIDTGLTVTFFDAWNQNKRIFVSAKVKLSLVGILENENNYSVEIIHTGKQAASEIGYLLISKNNNLIKAKIHSQIAADNTKTDVKIISFSGEKGSIDIDGIIDLAPNHIQMAGHLTEENIFLGSTGKIRGIPTLLVKSDDVEASHACKIHKISDEKLFYLRSRGIKKMDANMIIIESQISEILKNLKKVDWVYYDELYKKVLEKIIY